jgi:hypothetical protein
MILRMFVLMFRRMVAVFSVMRARLGSGLEEEEDCRGCIAHGYIYIIHPIDISGMEEACRWRPRPQIGIWESLEDSWTE